MENEPNIHPAPRKPYEVFGLTENEALSWRVDQERFEEIINDDPTIIHEIKDSSNTFGEFLFVTASRPGHQGRICMTFYGQGFHEYRERWLVDEWFWYQATSYPELIRQKVELEEALELLQKRADDITPDIRHDIQSENGELFEMLADLTDDDGALAEFQDFEKIADSLTDSEDVSEMVQPTGKNLLDDESREKLPPLYSGEEQGLDAFAQVKFFTPDSNWTWLASEFDGEDILFGLVVGLEIELGYFSLSELQSVKGPLGLPIERDLYFEPQSLRSLRDKHRQERGGQ